MKVSIDPRLLNSLFMRIAQARAYLGMRRLQKMALRPEAQQLKTLKSILALHSQTEFGQQFDFSDIDSVTSYRAKLPVFEYEGLRPYIEKQEVERVFAINSQHPALYAVTSGTTGKPKYIPLLPSSLVKLKSLQKRLLDSLLLEHADALAGQIATIASPVVEGYFPGTRTPVGSTSGHLTSNMAKLVTQKYVFPKEVAEIQDYDLKYKTIVRILLSASNVTFLGTANPSTIAKIVATLNANWQQLLNDLERGEFAELQLLPKEIALAVKPKLTQNKQRAEDLRKEYLQNGKLQLKDLLPHLKLINTWTGGSAGIFLDQIKEGLSSQTTIRELGYLASELRGNTPLSSQTNAGLPALDVYFYEFVQKEDWEQGDQKFVGLHELEDQNQYYIFVTTDSGLYRYNMNDIVEVQGKFGKTPLIRFVQKGKGVTNITGEKLYESQVIKAIQAFEHKVQIHSSFFIAVADEANAQYVVYYEPIESDAEFADESKLLLVRLFDQTLRETNLEYDAKRSSGRLRAPVVHLLKLGTFERYKQSLLQMGQREGQFKIIALTYAKDLRFDFASFVSKPNSSHNGKAQQI